MHSISAWLYCFLNVNAAYSHSYHTMQLGVCCIHGSHISVGNEHNKWGSTTRTETMKCLRVYAEKAQKSTATTTMANAATFICVNLLPFTYVTYTPHVVLLSVLISLFHFRKYLYASDIFHSYPLLLRCWHNSHLFVQFSYLFLYIFIVLFYSLPLCFGIKSKKLVADAFLIIFIVSF